MARRYLLDTGPAGDWVDKRGPVYLRAVAVARAGGILGTCVPVVGELWYGMENSSTRDENIRVLARRLKTLTIWPYDLKAAREFGRLFALLKRIGRAMQQIDIQIAAVALVLGNTTVVTKDSDLSAAPGLAVEDWSGPGTSP
jgi:tRNA(fMet)-specific endonuclease VapC